MARLDLAEIKAIRGDLAGALDSYREAAEMANRLAKDFVAGPYVAALAKERIGNALIAQGELDAALGAYRELAEIAERLVKDNPESEEAQYYLAISSRLAISPPRATAIRPASIE
jgi:tetratricopeptide (TPR) repeat protein